MPRSKEKKKRPGPSKVNVERAVQEVLNTNLSIRAAAKQFGTAKSALARHIKNYKSSGQNQFVKPEDTSLARSTSFNKETVAAYKSALAKGKFEPSRIYNVDETGITTVQQPPKILTPKEVKQIGGMTSAERGVLVTMICCINAAGNTVPPLLVFPLANFKNHMLKGAPVGAIGAANKSGWSNEDVFFKYLQHFISHVKPTIEDKVILLLDNHESHVSIPTIDLANRSGVILVTFHPHTSHRMQPPDVCVYGPFKTYYSSAVSNWMNTPGNAGKPITIYDVAELANTAYLKAFTPSNITKGFQVSGLYPLNSDIFGEQDFLPSNVTDRTDPSLSKASSQIKPLSSNETSVITAAVSPQTMSPSLNVSLSELENQPSSSDITVPP
ncbi:hypothetical protein NQ314_009464 [Rhamnusium bicolor]|uniref:DDE-1 domain-containing protein n=1 Tax=Rhamnusium bicolor TaxID=1586634 RepID=A0AAV8Y036_9CUCU|nr:hypothetical protein NQ314_009464 [Rhamnusium bicolor]